ncbi:MAG: D-alanyl-D-alanine carboxypeptidase [Rudaea sp.]|uniref:D-alanyl-D-alanine carboxypeptidase family protein n=1 Tax=unclassified Rudaea TaxID=2627037 RepID=UPI0010F43C15|nr:MULTISPECIES: D-alanyl-D-alanine carboxypeptidase family protein [unclassified Rudaea]MBN8886972.1 D-alanyl-D-alanine carboxypeptidase [Rudaea sp.]MBR0343655.1 D-alanyl-D-alanine carboxypeptidase [Rudaea sp.]
MKNLQFVQKAALCIFTAAALIVAAPEAGAVKHRRQQAQQKQEQKSAEQQKSEDAAAAEALPVQPATPMPGANALNVPVPPQPQLNAKSWVLMDFTSGQVLAGDNIDTRVEPASITKVMTSYVVSAQLAAGKVKMDDEVYISENAWRGGGASTDGSTSFLKLNSKVPLKDLLYGMIIQSGNDAAIALAEHVAGSEQTFAALMNQYAQQLGMTGTHYVNPTGLPSPDEYTTARDIALLSRALIHNYPEEYKIYSIKEFEWNGITQHNRNSLLWRDSTVDGIKTGHTKDAGFCLATSAKRGDQRLIAVVMGTGSEKERADANQTVLNYGFRFFETHKLFDGNKALASPALWRGANDSAALGLAEDMLITLPRGRYKDLKPTMDMPSRLIAPYTKGQQVGTVRVKLDDKVLVERPLVVLEEQPEGGFWRRFIDGIVLFFKSAPTTETAPVGTATVGNPQPAPIK